VRGIPAAIAAALIFWVAAFTGRAHAEPIGPACAAYDLPHALFDDDDDEEREEKPRKARAKSESRIEKKQDKPIPRGAKMRCGVPVWPNLDGLVAACRASGWSSPGLTSPAVDRLVDAGLFSRGDFSGVRIRFCGTARARGFTPDGGNIFLSSSVAKKGQVQLAALIAHEMIHIKQYRRMGDSETRCAYARASLKCNHCSNASHPMERPAYAMERKAGERLRALARR
jgi:hypothetical protein